MAQSLWTGTLKELIAFARTDPPTKENLGMNAATRLYQAVTAKGVTEGKTLDERPIKIYKYFEESIFGKDEEIDELMNVIYAAANRAEIGRNLIILVGPAGNAKSTIAQALRDALEGATAYGITGCPMDENPLKFLPRAERAELCKELGILPPPGDICPWCAKRYQELKHWEDLPVNQFVFSRNQGRGIAVVGTAQDPQEVDISPLIGNLSMRRMTKADESDPEAWDARKGALFRGNNGIVEIIEILKHDAKYHKVFSTVCQEAAVEIEGIGSVTGLDTLLLGHTNPDEFNRFLTLKGGEWLRRRVVPINVRHVIDRASEEKVQRKLVNITNFGENGSNKVHISPHTFKMLASLGILSRLIPSEKVNFAQKTQMYAKEHFEGEEDLDVRVKDVYKDGKEKGEGTTGLDSTTLSKMIVFALGRADKCLFALDLADEMTHFLESGLDGTVKDRSQELNETIKKFVPELKKSCAERFYKDAIKCFLGKHREDLENMFTLYLQYCQNFTAEHKRAEDEKTKQEEQHMRRIESKLGISESGKREWRMQVLVQTLNRGSRELKDFPKIEKAIEAIMIQDLRPQLELTLKLDDILNKDEREKRRNVLFEQLKEMGYCEKCAKRAIEVASDTMRKEA